MNVPALRLRVERLLDGADLHPAGLSSGAVFIVRKLHNLAPVSLSILSHTRQPAWMERVRNQATDLYSTAARPALGQVASNATSVLFADPGEMLTCLTRDLLTGSARQYWYWQQLLRNVPRATAPALAALWCEQAAFVPTVLGSLRIAEAQSALSLLAQEEVSRVISALHSSFDIPSTALAALLHEVSFPAVFSDMSPGTHFHGKTSSPFTEPKPAGWLPGETTPGLSGSTSAADDEPTDGPLFVPPWQRWLPGETSHVPLSLQACYLLGLGLALYYAPSFARSTQFAARAVSWLRSELSMQHSPSRGNRTRPEPGIVRVSEAQEERRFQDDHLKENVPTPSSIVGDSSETLAVALETSDSVPEISSDTPVTDTPAGPQPTAEPLQHQALDVANAASDGAITGKSQTPAGKAFMFNAGKALPIDGVATRLSGILYLVNLLAWLDLPSAWDEEGTFTEHMSGWGIIEALARGLLGTIYARFLDDPIWHVLALLDRREPGLPVGAGLSVQTAFRLPAQWLRRYVPGGSVWIATVDDARMFLLDETAGYLVADVPLSGRSFDEALMVELETYRAQGVNVRIAGREDGGRVFPASGNILPATTPAGNLEWWLERVLDFVCHLLVRALGEPNLEASRLAEILFCKQGRLLVSRTHIDLHMSMEQISLLVRRAGLDRDPGWVPDLGYIIFFHFD